MKNYQIIINNKKGVALGRQSKINVFNYPFTLNTNTGCLFACPYCYLRFVEMFKRHAIFGKEVYVKLWLPNKLQKDLVKYRDLAQQYKRVQINPAVEGYLPQLYKWFNENNITPTIQQCLELFKKEKDEHGSTWMLHLVTKSLKIKRDIDIIEEMKDQIQVEITITTLNKKMKPIFEPYAPSAKKRLELIEEFAKRGIFVRVMAMPTLGKITDRDEIWKAAKDYGAKAFKSKGLNYTSVEDLIKEHNSKGEFVAKRIKGRNEDPNIEKLILSGEPYKDSNGITPVFNRKTIVKSKKKNIAFEEIIQPKATYMDFGYRKISNLNWGDCK